MKFYKVSWEEYEKSCIQLTKRLDRVPIDKIVAISRGGLVVARILSDLLAISVSHITIESYRNLKQKKYVTITEVPSVHFNNQSILIVDEIADSGRTFKRALSYFKNFHLKKILTLALYVKSITKPPPDLWAKKIDAWVIFPYEVKETYDTLTKLYKSNKKARKKMLEVGFKEWEIEQI